MMTGKPLLSWGADSSTLFELFKPLKVFDAGAAPGTGFTAFVFSMPLMKPGYFAQRANELTKREGSFPVRWKRSYLQGRVNRYLQLRFELSL